MLCTQSASPGQRGVTALLGWHWDRQEPTTGAFLQGIALGLCLMWPHRGHAARHKDDPKLPGCGESPHPARPASASPVLGFVGAAPQPHGALVLLS